MNILAFLVFQYVNTASNNLQRSNSVRESVRKAFDKVGKVFKRSDSKPKEPIYEEILTRRMITISRIVHHDSNRRSLPRLPTQITTSEEFAERSTSCPECLLHRRRNNSELEYSNISRTRNNSESTPKCFYYKFNFNLFGLKELYTGNSLNSEDGYTIMHGSLPNLEKLKTEMDLSIRDFISDIINQSDDLDDEIQSRKNSFLLEVVEKLNFDYKIVLFDYEINMDLFYVQLKVEEFKSQIEEALIWRYNECLCDLCKEKFIK